ncbi:hypothetical protein [Thiocapsa marina]|uniref:hypothetical protein n=1 Tax=Thiocapsa marina TaxID=244573 RepID=UPI0013053ABE|nr:hypothetical protein [Thiocapsa marina]
MPGVALDCGHVFDEIAARLDGMGRFEYRRLPMRSKTIHGYQSRGERAGKGQSDDRESHEDQLKE